VPDSSERSSSSLVHLRPFLFVLITPLFPPQSAQTENEASRASAVMPANMVGMDVDAVACDILKTVLDLGAMPE
jgi:hypothetical protein